MYRLANGHKEVGAFFLESLGFMWYKGLRNLFKIGIMDLVWVGKLGQKFYKCN